VALHRGEPRAGAVHVGHRNGRVGVGTLEELGLRGRPRPFLGLAAVAGYGLVELLDVAAEGRRELRFGALLSLLSAEREDPGRRCGRDERKRGERRE
jgi:hypothetical protein